MVTVGLNRNNTIDHPVGSHALFKLGPEEFLAIFILCPQHVGFVLTHEQPDQVREIIILDILKENQYDLVQSGVIEVL